MSFDINWNLLRDGNSAEQLQRWLNDRLREMDDKRPSFLGPLSVTDLDFGEKPPTIAIQDIKNVIDEWYLPDDFDIYNPNTTPSNVAQLLAQASLNENESAANDNSSAASSVSPQKRRDDHHSHSHQHNQFGMPPKTKNLSLDDIVAQYAQAMRRETDIQVEILVDYKGDFKLSLSTELIVNQPTPAFITLPLTLTLTGFSFTAVAVVSYLGDRINFCFKEMGDNRGLFNDIHIDSEIGDKDRQQGVLKNVGKIEKFILLQIQTLISEHLVYPNYHCLSLITNDEEYEENDAPSSEIQQSE
ncbi:Mitochondrial distribution and morphology protein 12 [Rhizoclosmatium sp. JEL0117]|nr:Mitochondrial distribution and morphology protein 12 [Rhizoclosmatium sp. JEL0117]